MNPEVPFPQAPTVLSPADQLATAFVLAAIGHKDQNIAYVRIHAGLSEILAPLDHQGLAKVDRRTESRT